MLLLIDFVLFDRAVEFAEAVGVESHHVESSRIVPFDELRSDQTSVRPIELLDHQPHGIGIEGHVVMEEQEESPVTLDQSQHRVRGPSETGVATEKSNVTIQTP